MKKWLYLIGLMIFFVANTNAANNDFLDVREGVAAKGAGTVFKSADDLIGAAGKLNKSRIGTVKGNADEIFNSLTKGGTRTPGGAYKLNDGTILNLHKSTTTKLPTISIFKPGQKAIKIRIE